MTASTRLYARIKVKPLANPFLVEINCTVFSSHHMTQPWYRRKDNGAF